MKISRRVSELWRSQAHIYVEMLQTNRYLVSPPTQTWWNLVVKPDMDMCACGMSYINLLGV